MQKSTFKSCLNDILICDLLFHFAPSVEFRCFEVLVIIVCVRNNYLGSSEKWHLLKDFLWSALAFYFICITYICRRCLYLLPCSLTP